MATESASRFFPILVIPVIIILIGDSNGFGDESFANHIIFEMTEQSKQVSEAMRKSTLDMKSSISSVASTLEKSESSIAQVKLLRNVADMLGRSVGHESVEEMGRDMTDAIRITNKIAKILSNKKIAKDLTSSIDKSVAELGSTIRYIGDNIVEISKQVQLRLNSSDLIHVARETKEGLVEAVNQLTTHWKVGVNTADLKDVGHAAAQELSKALQNINAKVEITIRISPELGKAILYISVAGGFAFAVLFVALVISLKGCRNCCVQMCRALGQGISSGSNKSNGDALEKEDATVTPLKPLNPSGRSKLVFVRKNEYRNDRRKMNDDDSVNNLEKFSEYIYSSGNGEDDFGYFPTLPQTWEKQAGREKRQKLRNERRLSSFTGKSEETYV